MYDLVLITTGKNAVRKIVEDNVQHFYIIDCANRKDIVLKELKNCIKKGVEKLFTYRCPYIIPQDLYSKVKLGAYNIHPSLLPKYPGLNPWFEIFENKTRETGVTIHHMDVTPDIGEIISQEKFEILKQDTIESARKKSDIVASNLLKKTLKFI